jgi:hypothetical protein
LCGTKPRGAWVRRALARSVGSSVSVCVYIYTHEETKISICVT